MSSADKQAVLHCLKSMIDEESCEECPLYGTTGTDHCEKDCVRLAIKALEQEPCEDAISRAEVLSHAKTEWGNGHEQPFDYVEVDVIKQLHPVTPAEKVGHWEWDSIFGCRRCSECHLSKDSKWSNYCPNCGAKMQEVKNETDY